MFPENHKKEVILAAGASTAAVVAVILARHREKYTELRPGTQKPNPDILQDERLSDERRIQLNHTAALILSREHPDRMAVIRELMISKSVADRSLGFLTQNGLVTRVPASYDPENPTPAHYAPTEALLGAMQETERYPLLFEAIKVYNLSDNS